MRLKRTISTAIALMAVLLTEAQKRLTISPEFPQRGDIVTISFDPRIPADSKQTDTIGPDAETVTLVFSFSTFYDQAYKIQMEKRAGLFTTSFPLERYATFGSFYLQSGDKTDKPVTGHYEVWVYGKDKKPLRDVYLHRGYSIAQQLPKNPAVPAMQAEMYKKELGRFPDNYEARLRLLVNQMNTATGKKKENLRQQALKTIADRFYANPTDMGNMNKVTMGYHIIGEAQRVDSIRKLVIEKYPGSDLAWELYISQAARERDTATRMAMLEKVLENETEKNAEAFSGAHHQLFELYAAKKDSAKALYHIGFMRKEPRDPYTPVMYKEITQTLLNNNLALDSAAWFAEYTLKMADSFPVGVIRYWPETGYVYPYTNDSMRREVYSRAKGNLHSMLAIINFKRGRLEEANKNIDAALESSMDKETADNAAWFFSHSGQENRLKELQAARIKIMEKDIANKRINIPAPSLKNLVTLEGKPIDTAVFRNKVILIDFWATWCVPCMEEMPYIQKLYDQYKNNPDVEFMIVNSGARNTLKDAQGWPGNKKYSFPVYFNTDPAVGEKFKFNVIPATYIINRKGNIIFSNIGFEGADVETKLKLQLEIALQGK